MPLTQKALDRLARLGYTAEPDLRFWRGLWESEGESFFWGVLRSEAKAAGEYRRWFRRLVAFAADCRRAVSPSPRAIAGTPSRTAATVGPADPAEVREHRRGVRAGEPAGLGHHPS